MRVANVLLLIVLAGVLCASPARAQGWPFTTPQYTTVTAPDGVPLAVQEWGNPRGPAMLLLHGFSLSSEVWSRQQDPALAARYRMVAFDLRGHGASGKPAQPEAYVDSRRWADDVAAVIRAKQIERPVIVAWSFGGNVAMHYVRHHGDAGIAGLVFIGSTGGMAERLHPLAADAAYLEADRQRRSLALADNIAGQRAFVRLMTVQPLPAKDAELWLVSTLQLPRYVRAAMAGMPLDNPDLIDKIKVPTLFVTGAADLSVPESQLRPLAQRLPRSTVSIYENTGHSAFAEQPQRFNRELMRFVDAAHTKPAVASAREAAALRLVRSYLDAHNRHDVNEALAHYAKGAQFVLSNGRGVARGLAEIGALEQLDAALGSWVEPIELRATSRRGEVVVSFAHVLEQSEIAAAIGVPLIIAQAVSEGFVVRRGHLLKVVQPAFAPACARAMGAGFSGLIRWLAEREDARRGQLLRSDGSIVLTAATAPIWIASLREWRGATGWAPNADDLQACASTSMLGVSTSSP